MSGAEPNCAAVESWAINDNAHDEPVLIEWGERS